MSNKVVQGRVISVRGIQCLYCYHYKDGRTRFFVRVQCQNRVCTETVAVGRGLRRVDVEKTAREAIERIKSADASKGPITEWVERYIETRQLKPKTANSYRRILKDYSLDEKRNEAQMLQTVASKVNVGQIARTVKTFFTWLAQNGVAVTNPAANVKIPKPKIRNRTLTKPEIQKFYAALDNSTDELRLFGRLLLETGARVGTVLTIHVKDLTPNGLFLRNHKCDRDYGLYVPLSQETGKLWNSFVASRSESALVFKSKTSSLCRQLRKLLDDNFNASPGVEKCVIHTLRHTAATMALQAGVSIDMVSRMMDHASIQTTMSIYAKASQMQMDQAYQKFFAVLDEKNGQRLHPHRIDDRRCHHRYPRRRRNPLFHGVHQEIKDH